MADPVGFITAKIASAIGGFFGGAAILTFIRPKTIGEAFVRGGVSVGSAIIFAGPLLKGLDLPTGWEEQLMAGFVTGFLAYSLLGMVANFLIKHKHNDIVSVVAEVKNNSSKPKD